MRVNRQVLLAFGLIFVQLCASVCVPSVSFAQSAAHSTGATTAQPHTATGYPSWRDYQQSADAIVAQGNYLWFGFITLTVGLDVDFYYTNITKWDITTNKAIATYTAPNFKQGLGDIKATAIAIDKASNVWVATSDDNSGISEFNGTNWQSFYPVNMGIPSGVINAITVDNSGNVWIGTSQGGIAEYNGSSWKGYSNVNSGSEDGAIKGLVTDKNGNVWASVGDFGGACVNNKPVLYGALDKFDGSKWTVYRVPIQNSITYGVWFGLTTDPSGNIWLGLFTYTDCNNPSDVTTKLAKFNGANWQLYDDAGRYSSGITTDAQGNIWGNNQDNIAEFNGTSWQSYQHPYRNQYPSSYAIYPTWSYSDIVVDANGNKWLGNFADYGLVKFNQTDAMLTQTHYGIDFNTGVGGTAPSQTFTFSAHNTNIPFSTAVSYTANTSGWLNITPTSNVVNADSSQNLTLNVNTQNLQAGAYTANVIIIDQNDPTDNLTVLVELRIGYVYYLPNFFGGDLPQSNIVVQNTSNTTTADITFEIFGGGYFYVLTHTLSLAPLAQSILNNNPLSNQGILISDQPLSVVLTNPINQGYGKSSVAVTEGGSQLIAPLILNNAFGGYTTSLIVFNPSSNVVTATVQYYDQTGKLVPNATANYTILRYQRFIIYNKFANNNLPAGFIGWAQITGSPGSNLVAQVVEDNSNGFSAAFNAEVAGSSTLYASTMFNNAFGGYDTGASIVNPNANPVNVTINYFDHNGNALPPASFTLPAHALTSIYQGGTQGKSGVVGIPDGGLPDGFYGSATITSQGGGVAMLVNEIGPANANTIASGSYTARPTAASSLTLPVICNGGYGYTTGLTVLNTSGAAVNATIQYFNTDGSALKNADGSAVTASFNISAHGSYPIYQGAAGLPSNFYGLGVVTTTSGPANALIATTNAISSGNFYTYTEPEM